VLTTRPEGERVSAYVTGLDPNVLYQFRLVADNGVDGPTIAGAQFTTIPPQPLASLAPVSDVAPDAATVNGTVDAMGDGGNFAFSLAEVGGAQRLTGPVEELPAAAGSVPVTTRFSGLKPGTTYTVGIYVSTGGGVTFADPVTFTTAGTPPVARPARTPDWSPTPYGCGAPRLTGVRGTVRAGQPLTLTGSDLGVYGVVTIGDEQAEIRAYAADAVTVVVPNGLSGRAAVTLDCGRAAVGLTLQIGRVSSNRLTISKAVVRGGTATLTVRVPGRGLLQARGRGLRGASARTTRSGSATIRVSLGRAGRRALARARGGRLRIFINLRFQPVRGEGDPSRGSRTVVFSR
jgi:hypothetical protein